MMTAVQGIVAAGTVACLTREATWERMAFASNHLFYLVGISAGAAAVEIPHFSLTAKAVFMMTPIVLFEHLWQGQESTPNAKAIGYYFNRFYYAAAVVSTLVLVALGHTAYGVGFFSVMALDMISRSHRVNAYIKTAFEWSANVLAVLTFASYAAKLATPRGQYLMALVGAQAFLPRIFKIVQDVLPASSGSSSNNEGKARLGRNPWQVKCSHYALMPVGLLPSHHVIRSQPGAFMPGLQNLTGRLPHDL